MKIPSGTLEENFLAVERYLDYRKNIKQRNAQTLEEDQVYLRELLEWAGPKPLYRAPQIRPPFPRWVAERPSKRAYENGRLRSAQGTAKRISCARFFLEWARQNLPPYRKLDPVWLANLRYKGPPAPPPAEPQYVTLEMVRQLLALPDHDDPFLIRGKAAVALLFVSAMRATAFASLPIACLNLKELIVTQYPSLGVKTKGRKSAVTCLLKIPDLLAAVQRWDDYVRPRRAAAALWFATLDAHKGLRKKDGPPAVYALRNTLKWMFARAGLPYHSAHKFRHGHARHTLKQAKTMADYKAVSQNMMHQHIGITDEIYGRLPSAEVKARIQNLSASANK